MSAVRTNAAAEMLGVSTNTLRGWERRFGFPRTQRSNGGHRHYELTEIEALRITLEETDNVSSAIALARERGEGPCSPARLRSAFAAFDEEAAYRLLDESLALRSVERTIEEVLLTAVSAHADLDRRGAEYEFGWRLAAGWLSAMKRLAPPATRYEAVLIFDASTPCELDALHAQALEVILRRAGLRTLSLTPAIEPTRLGRAVRALEPRAVVMTGRGVPLQSIGRLVYAVRSVASGVLVFDYRGSVPDTGGSMVCRLGETPRAAADTLLARLDISLAASAAQQSMRERSVAAMLPRQLA
jgi:hypothetical protein